MVYLGIVAGLVGRMVWKREIHGLAGLRFRRPSLLFAALALQLVARSWQFLFRSPVLVDWAPPMTIVVSYAFLLVFLISNIRKPGFWLLMAGVALNLLPILANGGFMPVTSEAAREVSVSLPWQIDIQEGSVFGKSIVLPKEKTRLWFLTDVLVPPDFLTLRFALSLGDLLLMAGGFWLIIAVPAIPREPIQYVVP